MTPQPPEVSIYRQWLGTELTLSPQWYNCDIPLKYSLAATHRAQEITGCSYQNGENKCIYYWRKKAESTHQDLRGKNPNNVVTGSLQSNGQNTGFNYLGFLIWKGLNWGNTEVIYWQHSSIEITFKYTRRKESKPAITGRGRFLRESWPGYFSETSRMKVSVPRGKGEKWHPS